MDPGTGYQQLSVYTEGFRYPVCEGSGFAAVFKHLGQQIEGRAVLTCELASPTPPSGSTLDPTSMQVRITPAYGAPKLWPQVANAPACTGDEFYFENNKLKLCPSACTAAKGDTSAKLEILYGCL